VPGEIGIFDGFSVRRDELNYESQQVIINATAGVSFGHVNPHLRGIQLPQLLLLLNDAAKQILVNWLDLIYIFLISYYTYCAPGDVPEERSTYYV